MMVQYIRKQRCETILLDEEWIVLNSDNYTITKLNQTGGVCWTLLANPQSVLSLAEALEEKYGRLGDSVQAELDMFLTELLEHGLVEHAG